MPKSELPTIIAMEELDQESEEGKQQHRRSQEMNCSVTINDG